jgi:SAM-dependent methyltransferase
MAAPTVREIQAAVAEGAKSFPSHVAAREDEHADPHTGTYQERTVHDLALVYNRLGRADIDLLDIGGGRGLFSIAAALLGARRNVLNDPVPRDPGTGEDQLSPFGIELDTHDAVREGIPLLEHQAFDAITSFHVLEHVKDSPKELFHRAVAALRPGGVFLLSGPNAVNLRKRLTVPLGRGKWSTMDEWYESPEFFGHVREPDVEDLAYIGRDLGLTDISVLGRNFLALASPVPWRKAAANGADRLLQRWPGLCSDIYLLGSKSPNGSA